MANPLFTKNFIAGAAITKYRIVKFCTDDDHVIQASSASDSIIGVSDSLGAGTGERVDVVLSGIAEIELGGSVNRGTVVTADASGRAVQCSPSTGVNQRLIGISMVGGTTGDIAPVLIALSVMQG